jgi:hypothetical protein
MSPIREDATILPSGRACGASARFRPRRIVRFPLPAETRKAWQYHAIPWRKRGLVGTGVNTDAPNLRRLRHQPASAGTGPGRPSRALTIANKNPQALLKPFASQ